MYQHDNAKLGLAGRLALVRAIEDGLSLKAAAAAFSVSPATAHRWWHRWLEGKRRPDSLLDRSSRPHRSPRLLAATCRSGSATAGPRRAGVRVWSRRRPASRTRRVEGAASQWAVAAAGGGQGACQQLRVALPG